MFLKKSPTNKTLVLLERRIQDTTFKLWIESEPKLWDRKIHGALKVQILLNYF